jgi:hypothetical protein
MAWDSIWLLALVLAWGLLLGSPVSAESDAGRVVPHTPAGTQEISLATGYLLPHRLTRDHTTKQQGVAVMPSWNMVLTDPVGAGWYRGQVILGAEMVYVEFREPVITHGVGFTPRMKYSFTALDRLRPYVEFAGGPFWTDLANKIPEQSTELNFILTAGFGVSYFLTSQTALNVGYRFHHFSNAGTRIPNLGINSSLPLAGFSFFF